MPKTQMERLWMIGAGFAAFILILIGYLVFISPQRDQTSQVNTQVATAQQQNDVLAQRISALSAQNKNLSTYQSAVARASAALPSTSGMPDFLTPGHRQRHAHQRGLAHGRSSGSVQAGGHQHPHVDELQLAVGHPHPTVHQFLDRVSAVDLHPPAGQRRSPAPCCSSASFYANCSRCSRGRC